MLERPRQLVTGMRRRVFLPAAAAYGGVHTLGAGQCGRFGDASQTDETHHAGYPSRRFLLGVHIDSATLEHAGCR